MDFTVPANHREKLKESKKKDKYLDLAWDLKKKQWKIKVMVIPIVIGTLGTVSKGLVKRQEKVRERMKTIQTTT